MAVSPEDIDFVEDLFAGLGPVSCRKMFGGMGVYLDDVIFAIKMSDGVLMLKGAGTMVDRYDDAGWERWTYTRKNGASAAMPYWAMPEDILDDPELACDWANKALSAL